MGITLDEAVEDGRARQAELDGYEDRYGKYVNEHGPFAMPQIKIGIQSFPVFWEDDPEETPETNAEQRRWFKRMLCCALHHLVEEQVALKERSDEG